MDEWFERVWMGKIERVENRMTKTRVRRAKQKRCRKKQKDVDFNDVKIVSQDEFVTCYLSFDWTLV